MNEPSAIHPQPRDTHGSGMEADLREVEENQHSTGLTGNESPQAWKAGKKCMRVEVSLYLSDQGCNLGICTGILVAMTATVAFCSSIYSAAIEAIAIHYDCSRLVSTLGLSTFLLGFAVGPLLFAPLSEIWSVPLEMMPRTHD